MHIVYNTGYKLSLRLIGASTGKKYKFVLKMVTEVDDNDAQAILALSHRDIPWCVHTDKRINPFLSLEDFCQKPELRDEFSIKTVRKVFEPEDYLKEMSLEV